MDFNRDILHDTVFFNALRAEVVQELREVRS